MNQREIDEFLERNSHLHEWELGEVLAYAGMVILACAMAWMFWRNGWARGG